MIAAPSNVRALREVGLFEFTWLGEPVRQATFHALRSGCPCAGCVNEWTGERILDPSTVPADIAPTALSPVGNYAVKIVWSDGHATGLYTWDQLHTLSQARC